MTQHVDQGPSVLAPPPSGAAPGGSRRARPRLQKVLLVVVGLAVAAAAVAFVGLRLRREPAPAPSASEVARRDGNAIVVSTKFRATMGIETTKAVSGPLAPLVKTIGVVEFDPTHAAAVGTRAPGIVASVMAVEGDLVDRGAVLAEIESVALAEAQADLKIASAKHRAAKINADRERELLRRALTTARESEEAEATLAQHQALEAAARERVDALGGRGAKSGVSEIRAPAAGVVAERSISPGQNVGPGLVAFRVGDLDALWVLLRVFERNLGLVREGDDVTIEPLADGARPIEGKVAHVGSVLDPATRTADVRVEVDNKDRLLRPGQQVTGSVRATVPARVALSIPKSAITYVDGAPTVFVAESATRFVPRTVGLGIDGGDRVEVTGGVAEGDEIVSKSVLSLKSELFR